MSKEMQFYIVTSIIGTWCVADFSILSPDMMLTDTTQDEPLGDVDWEQSLNDLAKLRRLCGREYEVSSYNDDTRAVKGSIIKDMLHSQDNSGCPAG